MAPKQGSLGGRGLGFLPKFLPSVLVLDNQSGVIGSPQLWHSLPHVKYTQLPEILP